MRTNQIMEIAILNGVIHVGHNDGFGSLSELFAIANRWREDNGKPRLRVDNYLSRQDTKEFLALLERKLGEPPVRTKRGRHGGVWAHVYVLLDAAAYLSPELKLHIYEVFFEKKILEWRDRSGDAFIDLNAMLALQANEVFGKPAHKGHYITLANIIRGRILGPEAGPKAWNQAAPEQLRERARIEEALTTMLKAGVVRDWDHLKELAEIV